MLIEKGLVLGRFIKRRLAREAQEFLKGSLRKDELKSAIVTSTMQLAKRQITWFKRDSETTWFSSREEWF